MIRAYLTPMLLLALVACRLCGMASDPALAHSYTRARHAEEQPSDSQPPIVFTMRGTAVSFDLSGLEPDFDPIYKVVISSTLHDPRTAGSAFPDMHLVLSMYLEVFQPDTTPVLPDLLHQDRVATNLAGFLSGKAALVNAGGQVVYRGSLLAEIFRDSTEHLVVDLDPVAKGPSVRLMGPITLVKGGSQYGTLSALQPLAKKSLQVRRGQMPSWQRIVAGMSVRKPTMVGTAGAPGKRVPAKPSTIAPLALTSAGTTAPACDTQCRFRRPVTLVPLGAGAVAILAGLLSLAARRRARART